MSMLDHAAGYAVLGFRVFALQPRSKVPATARGCKDGSADLDEISAMWADKSRNIGVACGSESGVLVLDIDGDDGARSLALWESVHGQLPTTPRAVTARGQHIYFRHPGEQVAIRNSAGKAAPGIDVRTDGGYVVAPPSVHPDGSVYAWAEGLSPLTTALAHMPEWLVKALSDKPAPRVEQSQESRSTEGHTRYGLKALDAECMELARHPEGGRNDKLNAVAFRIGQLVASGHLAEGPALADARRSALACGLGERETAQTIASGFKAGYAAPSASDPDPEEWRRKQEARRARSETRGAEREPGEDDDPGEMPPPHGERVERAEPVKPAHASMTSEQVVGSAYKYLTDTSRQRLPRSGFPMLDDALGGFPPGTLFTVGGRTGSGKSSLLLAMAMNIATKQSRKVGIVSCEDVDWIWGARILATTHSVSPDEFFKDTPSPEAVIRAKAGVQDARDMGVHFEFALGKPPAAIVALINGLVRNDGCELIMVDYLQAIAAKGQDRYVARTDAAQELKAACYGLGVPLVLASQLKRPEGGNAFREPTNNELKDSGDIENMSEAIALLWPQSDAENATTIGKVTKVKWSPRRPKFQVERNGCGALVGLSDPPQVEPAKLKSASVDFGSNGGWRGY